MPAMTSEHRTIAGALRPGVYEHHGRFYLFEKLCREHDTDEWKVAYTPLWTDPKYVGPRTSLRPIKEFYEEFKYVGPTYEGQPTTARTPSEGASAGA